jgi:ATP-dependent exoDNAse (exonuclease V) alpha subunit
MAIARFRHELASGRRQAPGADTIVIVDEAGMVGVRDLAAIFEAATLRSAAGEAGRSPKILLSGDRRQLAAVAGGSALKAVSDIIERRATLTGVRRQTVDWQRVASIAMAQGDSEAGLRAYAEHGRIDLVAGPEAAQALSIQAWQDLRQSHGDDVIIVTRRNRDAVALNLVARKVLREEGLIHGPDLSPVVIDRDGDLGALPLATGDLVRFGETLPQHRIRNGTRGKVEKCARGVGVSIRAAIRLEDGRLIEDAWSGFAQQRRRRHAGIPRIVHAVAGSAYSVQGRTAPATVHYIASAADARETYVALTRHRHDMRIVVESDRLDAACRGRQEDPRMAPTRSAMLELLFNESRRYNEKENVVDHVADRVNFIETGSIDLPRSGGGFNIVAAVDATRRIELAAQFVGVRSRAFTVQLRQLVKSILPDREMPEMVKTIMEKVQSWTRTASVSHSRQKSPAHEYDR